MNVNMAGTSSVPVQRSVSSSFQTSIGSNSRMITAGPRSAPATGRDSGADVEHRQAHLVAVGRAHVEREGGVDRRPVPRRLQSLPGNLCLDVHDVQQVRVGGGDDRFGARGGGHIVVALGEVDQRAGADLHEAA
ncbi:MAG: hypothetical protein R2755_12670 [Acidimicrobiales bacterium]